MQTGRVLLTDEQQRRAGTHGSADMDDGSGGMTRNPGKELCLSFPLLLAPGEEAGRRSDTGCAVVVAGPGPANTDKTPW